MPITMQQVLARLDTDEPDYAALATLGPEAVPHLKVLVRSDDPGIASKAAYLASMIESDESTDVVEAASASPHESVRVAAAAGMRNLAPAQAGPWVERLLDDNDAGVRKQALQAAAALGMSGLEPKVKKMAASDPEKGLRQLAKQGLQRISKVQSASPKEAKPAETKPAKRAARRPPKRGKK
jgi:HEAT repeat protein